jgi:hypothetical protein
LVIKNLTTTFRIKYCTYLFNQFQFHLLAWDCLFNVHKTCICKFVILSCYFLILLSPFSVFFKLFLWCCHITMDSAMAASQNAFFSYKLSCHKKTNIMQTVTKILKFYFINLLSLRNCETRSFYDTFHELCKHRFVTQPLQNPPFCSSTVSFVAFCFLAFQPFLAENWLISFAFIKVLWKQIRNNFTTYTSFIFLYILISHIFIYIFVSPTLSVTSHDWAPSFYCISIHASIVWWGIILLKDLRIAVYQPQGCSHNNWPKFRIFSDNQL